MIHLHIGRHKTGTSAIQHFLSNNRAALAERGFDYPAPLDGTRAHHSFARALPQAGGRTPWEVTAADLQELERFTGLGRTSGQLIISSERLQSADPQAVRALWPGRDLQVIVYLREPLDYMLSSYAQAVHARTLRTSLVDYARRFKLDYTGFVGAWAEAFGEDAIRFRLYERGRMEGGDVRRDLLQVVGLDPEGLRFGDGEANPSLGPELLEFKGLVNAALDAQRQSQLKIYMRLSRMTGRFPGRLRVSPAFAESFRAPLREGCAALLQRYTRGEILRFEERADNAPILPVDRAGVCERVLAVVAEQAPNVAALLRRQLPSDPAEIEPLLPRDWDAAVRELQASGSGSGA